MDSNQPNPPRGGCPLDSYFDIFPDPKDLNFFLARVMRAISLSRYMEQDTRLDMIDQVGHLMESVNKHFNGSPEAEA